MIKQQPSRATLFPYTTLFRSLPGRQKALRYIQVIVGQVLQLLGLGQRRLGGFGKRGAAVESAQAALRSEEHTSELQSQFHLVCRLLLEKKKKNITQN